MNIELPVATNVRTITDSLYQQCLKLIEKIYPLDGFQEILFPDNDFTKISDPVKIIWDMCRLGYPLCLLYNLLQPATPLEVKQGDNVSKANASKRFVFLFIKACRTDLHIPEDELFNITDVFKDDTNLFVKVVNVINILIKTIEDRGFYPEHTDPLPFNIPNSDEIEAPKDNRAKLVAELLNTERSYVQDLERLHNYQLEAESKVLSKEDSILLFSNLGELLDFQRRFLIHMEAALAVPTQEQHIGQLFSNMETGFKVYQVFCANQDKAAKFAQDNCDALMPLVNLMEPKYELPSYLIKPVQRICKYPLLLNELMKYDTKAGHPYCHELQKGLDSIKRVTELTNEIKRQEENEQLTEELKNKIQDWKNVKVDELGLLLLRGNFTISSGDNEREYVLYLFQNMLLCCQEKKEKKKKGKNKITYILKGSIYISSVIRVSNKSVVSQNLFQLKIYWSDKSVKQCFILKSISEEQCNRWITQIEKLINIEKQKNLTLERKKYYNYNNQYVSRVNQVDGMFTDEDYDNKVHGTQSMYNKPVSRNTYTSLQSKNLNRSKSQPNIFDYNSKNQDVPPVPSYSSSSVASPALSTSSIYNSSPTNSVLGRKNLNPLREAGSSSFSMDTLPPPQRTVSSHVKHNPSQSNSSRHYPKYNDSYNDSFRSESTYVPSTPLSGSSRPSLYNSLSDITLNDENSINTTTTSNNNNNNNSNSNSNSNSNNNNNSYYQDNRRTYQSKPLKINVENNSGHKYNEDKGSLSPSSTNSNSLSISLNEQYNEPVSPSSSYYNRNQYSSSYYNKPGLSKKNDNYNDNTYRNDYSNDYDYYDSSRRSEYSYDSSRRSEYSYDSSRKSEYSYEGRRNDYNEGRRSEYSYEGRRNDYNEGRRSEYNYEGRRNDYNEGRRSEYNYEGRRNDYNEGRKSEYNYERRSEYSYEGRRNDYNEGRKSEYNDNYGYDREKERDRIPYERNKPKERPLREKDEYDRYRRSRSGSHSKNPNDLLNTQPSISGFSSYENNKKNSVISNNSNSNRNSNSSNNTNNNTSNNDNNDNNDNNNDNNENDNNNNNNNNNENNSNYVNDSLRVPTSPPHTPVSHPSSPNLSRPSLTNLKRPLTPNHSRPSTPNLSRPTTPNLSRPTTPNHSRPSTPNYSRPTTPNLSSRLNNMNVRRPTTPLTSNYSSNTDNVRSSYTKIRINYKDQEFIIPAPSTGCTYGELLSKIERKIRLNDKGMNETGPLRIRYKDEDDDYVTIITDEDIKLAFEVSKKIWRMKKDTNNEPLSSMIINLYVDRK